MEDCRVLRRAWALAAFILVGVVAAPAAAASDHAVARFAVDPDRLDLDGVRVGDPVFRGHEDWNVFEVSGDLAALRDHPKVRWVERPRKLRAGTPEPRHLDVFPNRLGAAGLDARPSPSRTGARAPVDPPPTIPAPPSDCTPRLGIDDGTPTDPLFCGEDNRPQAYYAEEWNHFCFTPAAHVASVKAAAPNSPDASGMCTQGAWRMGAQGQGTVIAILDSGIKYDHPELADRMASPQTVPALEDPDFPGTRNGWNFYDDTPETMDFNGHGTGRAGIAAATADNGQMTGTAPKARLLAVKVGDTYVVSAENAAQGIVYAADHGADAINTSLGVVGNSRLLRMAALYANEKGVFFAAATANEYSNHHNFPTNLDTVQGVTGLGPNLGVTQAQQCQNNNTASNCAPAQLQTTFLQKVNYANYGGIADFAAPIDTMSTGRGDFTAGSGTSGPHASGTSTAAPHLAGAAAIVRSAGYLAGFCQGHAEIDGAFTAPCVEPALSADEVKQILAYTATRVHNDDAPDHNYPLNPSGDPTLDGGGEYYPATLAGSPVLGWNQWSGFGRPNVFAAAAYARSGLVPPEVQLFGDTPPPTADFEGLKGPGWFSLLDPARTPTVPIVGHVDTRPLPAGQQVKWQVQVAPCLEPHEDDYDTIATGTGPKDGVLANWTLPTQLGACAETGDSRPFSPPGTTTIRVRAAAADTSGFVTVDNPVFDDDPDHSLPETEILWGQDRRVVHVRPKAAADRPGSPHYLGASGEGSPTLYDLEGRGELDVIVGTADGEIQVRRPDGTMVPGWPAKIDELSDYVDHVEKVRGETPRSQVVGTPAIGDIDGDGLPEVVASALTGKVYAWERDGSRVDGFPVAVPPESTHVGPGNPYTSTSAIGDDYCTNPHPSTNDQRYSGYGHIAAPVLADLDTPADGRMEIVQAAGNMCVYGIEGDGDVRWRKRFKDATADDTPTKIAATPAVGDLDDDGDPDVVLGTEEVAGSLPNTSGRLYAFDAKSLAPLTGWPAQPTSVSGEGVPTVATGIISSPALFGDGPRKVITGMFLQGDPQTPVRVYNDGAGTAAILDTQSPGAGANATDFPFHYGVTQTAVGLLGAGPTQALSIVTGGFSAGLLVDTAFAPGKKTDFQHLVGAWNAQSGAPLPTFPRQIEDWQFLSGPAIADVKGDGTRQVIAGSGAGLLHAYDPAAPPSGESELSTSLQRYPQFEEPAGFPVFQGGQYMTSTPTVGQLQRGGKVTVASVTRDGYLYLTETAGKPEANDQWWHFHHDERNTGVHGLDTRPPASPDDFAVTGTGPGEVRVSWTATGDDWWVGKAKTIDLRWSTSPITDDNFGSAVSAGAIEPADSGQPQSKTLELLPQGQPIYVAMRAQDDAGNWSVPVFGSNGVPGTGPGGGGGPAVAGACRTPQLTGARVRPASRGRALRFSFTRRGSRPVSIEVRRQSRGRKVLKPHIIKRFSDRTRGVRWNGRRRGRLIPKGIYLATFKLRRADRVVERFNVAFQRRGKRFRARKAMSSTPACVGSGTFGLNRAAFGGRRSVPLRLNLRLGSPAKVTVTVLRGRRVVRRVATSRSIGVRGIRLIIRPRGLRRGEHRVRVTLEAFGGRVTRTFVARRI